ncbi:hypothetical protein GCM10007368_30230 [Isoptericola cucumis]|uniref:Uncharacterized protein n=1 Tax=Isoptericola cucumis TaxID=1776856 RepID=A0ABQ2BAI1_9MICO|nr:hypothetical protein GCM10007368_30230 [Isoptericola cucumis]
MIGPAPEKARDAVDTETPARSATRARVGLPGMRPIGLLPVARSLRHRMDGASAYLRPAPLARIDATSDLTGSPPGPTVMG